MICNISDKHIAMAETKKCYQCKHIYELHWKSKSKVFKCAIDNCEVRRNGDACLMFKTGENE